MTYGIKDVCKRYGVGQHTVLSWIHRGQLKAIDVSRELGGPPRWRITQQALEAFEAARMHLPEPPRNGTRRRERTAEVIEFYK